jgi:hypothetical protein
MGYMQSGDRQYFIKYLNRICIHYFLKAWLLTVTIVNHRTLPGISVYDTAIASRFELLRRTLFNTLKHHYVSTNVDDLQTTEANMINNITYRCLCINKWAASRQNQHSAFATSMASDQPAHPRSLTRIHAVRYQFLYLL